MHVPFCAHRCGYCDFVTVVGREGLHGRYVDALLAELELEREVLAQPLETVFLGGGTPTFTEAGELRRLLAALPPARRGDGRGESRDRDAGARPPSARGRRDPRLAGGADLPVRTSCACSSAMPARTTSVAPSTICVMPVLTTSLWISSTGYPARAPPTSSYDIEEALALSPEHVSYYELEAKPGTRFTHAHGAELARQAEAMEGYFELVIERLTDAGYRWYETANFCRAPEQAQAA